MQTKYVTLIIKFLQISLKLYHCGWNPGKTKWCLKRQDTLTHANQGHPIIS